MHTHADVRFNWRDPLLLEQQLTDDERMVRDTARAYCQEKLAPRVLEAFRSERSDAAAIYRELGELDMLAITIPERVRRRRPRLRELRPRRARSRARRFRLPLDDERAGLARHDARSTSSARPAQKQKFIPKLATGEWIGCFGLTEPNHGSDPGGMMTRAKTSRRRIRLDRNEIVDHEQSHRRRLHRLGQGRCR